MSQQHTTRRPQRRSRRAHGIAAMALAAFLLAGCGQSPEQMLESAKGYIAKQDLNAATIQLKNALQENGDLTEARFLLGRIQLEQGDLPSAVKDLTRASELGYPRNEVAPVLARALSRAGEFDRLLKEFGDVSLDDSVAQAVVLAALGEAHLGKGEVDKAQALFTAALDKEPAEHHARIGLARTYVLGRDVKAAEAEVRDVIQRAPDFADAHAMLADVLLLQGMGDESVASLREAVRLAPRAVNYHFALVSQLLQQNRIADAETALSAMQSVAGGHPATGYLKAYLDYRGDRLVEARDGLMQVLKRAPDYLPAEMLAGTVLVRLNEHALGRVHLGRVLERAPGAAVARQALIASHLATGEAQRALELLQPLLQIPEPDVRMLGLAGQVFLANGDFERSEEYFERAARAQPEDAQARIRLGIARMAGGDASTALLDLEAASSMDESGIQADLALVMAHLRRGEFDKALRAQEQLESKGENALVSNLRGGLMLARRDVPAARAAFEKALSLQPDYLAAAVNLARLDLAERRMDDALGRIRAVIDRNPKSLEAHLTLAQLQRGTGAPPAEVLATLERAEAISPGAVAPNQAIVQHLLAQREYPRALQVAQRTAAAHPDDPRAVDMLARAQVASGSSQQAISSLNRLATLLPASPAPFVQLAEVQRGLGNTTAAEQAFRRAITIAPGSTEIQQRLIGLLVERGDREGALRVALDAQRANPDRPGGYLLEGEILASAGRWAEAAKSLTRALELNAGASTATRLHAFLLRAEQRRQADALAADWLKKHPTDLTMRGYLAELALAENRYPDAAALFRKMQEMAPQNPLILNNLAWTANVLGDAQALEYAEQAVRLAPDNPAILDTLGVIQVERGQIDEGLANLQRAVSLGPDLLPLQLNLAKSLVKAGRRDEARTQLESLIQRLPRGSQILKDAQALLTGL